MIKAIIFDCYGVLVGKGIWHTYAAAGGDLDKDAEFLENIIVQASAGLIKREAYNKAIADKLGLAPEAWLKIKEKEERLNIELFEYIRDNLKPKYRIGLLSNANSGVVDKKIPSEFWALFDATVISAEVGVQKPDPQIYEIVTDRLGASYEEAIFIDDQERYLVPAQKLGMHTICYRGFSACKSAIDTIVYS